MSKHTLYYIVKKENAKRMAHKEGYILASELIEEYKDKGVSIGFVYYWIRKLRINTKNFNGMVGIKNDEVIQEKFKKLIEKKSKEKTKPSMTEREREALKSPYFSPLWMFMGRGKIFKTEAWQPEQE